MPAGQWRWGLKGADSGRGRAKIHAYRVSTPNRGRLNRVAERPRISWCRVVGESGSTTSIPDLNRCKDMEERGESNRRVPPDGTVGGATSPSGTFERQTSSPFPPPPLFDPVCRAQSITTFYGGPRKIDLPIGSGRYRARFSCYDCNGVDRPGGKQQYAPWYVCSAPASPSLLEVTRPRTCSSPPPKAPLKHRGPWTGSTQDAHPTHLQALV